MLSSSEFHECVRWSPDGQSFVFKQTHPKLLEGFTRFFRHSNVHSFVRQLNIYGFARLTTTQLLGVLDALGTSLHAAEWSGFSHPSFNNSPDCDLSVIKPRSSSGSSKSKRNVAAAALAAASDDEDVKPPAKHRKARQQAS